MWFRLRAWLIYTAIRLILGLRYRVRVTGLDDLEATKGGILFLPNHVATFDSVLLMTAIEQYRARPVIVESFFYAKAMKLFVKSSAAVPMPDFDAGVNNWKIRQFNKVVQEVASGLKSGDNFLVFPSGRLKETVEERVGGSVFVADLVHTYPQANVALVRIRGFWGSMFSRAPTGRSPELRQMFKEGLKILFKNGIFFAPRREITIEIERARADFPVTGSKTEINAYLERWYNEKPDQLKCVPFYFWSKECVKIAPSKIENKELIAVPHEVENAVLHELSKIARREKGTLKKEMSLTQDLGLDSLDIAEIAVFLELRFQVKDLVPVEIQTIEDLLQVAARGNSNGTRKNEQETVPANVSKWLKDEAARPIWTLPEGNTLQEAFLRSCDRMGRHFACADNLSGALTYRDVKTAALVLSQKIENLPGKHIGIMLPASSAVYIITLATLLAKKVPVMLNWTAGSRSLDHALDVAGVESVISSYRFLSRLNNSDMGQVEERIQFVEEMRMNIPLSLKLKGLLWSFYKAPTLLKKLQLNDISSDSTGVILFTSGTEAMPKGVPLSHDNILSNQRSALSTIAFKNKDCFLGCLPPFHSFGLSAMGLLPLLSGVKIFFYPDPTNGSGMAKEVGNWKPTVMCAAPGFISGLLRGAEPGQLKSIRLFISGAEKASKLLYDQIGALGDTLLLEGYGITECSPFVSIQREDQSGKGVGGAIPGIELLVIHPETEVILEQGQEGEVCISGSNVFKGYLEGKKLSAPFIRFGHKQWYRSGDRGRIDSEGILFLTGRMKRFVKIGGEMVGLGGLELDLMDLANEKNWLTAPVEGPPLAVIAVNEGEANKVSLILFTVFDVKLEELNLALREKGVSALAKISEWQQMDQIPLTGTGKTNYRLLEELWKEKQLN